MSDELRQTLDIFEYYAGQQMALSPKEHLDVLCRGYAAAARGWRLLAIGQGVENEIVANLEQAIAQLMIGEKRAPGAPPPPDVRDPAEVAVDAMLLRRFLEREPYSLTLRHFVEKAFDAGELAIFTRKKNYSINVHVQRLQRRVDRLVDGDRNFD